MLKGPLADWAESELGFGLRDATTRFCLLCHLCCCCCSFPFFPRRQPLPSPVSLPSPAIFNTAITSFAISLCRTRKGKAKVRVLRLASVATVTSPAATGRRHLCRLPSLRAGLGFWVWARSREVEKGWWRAKTTRARVSGRDQEKWTSPPFCLISLIIIKSNYLP